MYMNLSLSAALFASAFGRSGLVVPCFLVRPDILFGFVCSRSFSFVLVRSCSRFSPAPASAVSPWLSWVSA